LTEETKSSNNQPATARGHVNIGNAAAQRIGNTAAQRSKQWQCLLRKLAGDEMGGVGGSGRVSTSTRPWCNTASGSSGKSKGKQTKNNNQPIGHRVARGDRSSYAKVTTGYFIQVAMKQQQHQQDAALYAPSALLCCAIYSKR